MVIKFKVPALRGQGRPRFSKYSGAYKSKEDIEYENLIKECFLKEAKGIKPSKRPVSILIEAFYKLPKQTPKYVKDELEENLYDYVPQSKPDIDNVAKSVLDALTGIAYVDDKQVYDLCCNKNYDVTSETCYLEVIVIYDSFNTLEDIKNERRRH